MTTNVVKNITKRLPNAGECWKHEDSLAVYMRIFDNHGKLIYPELDEAAHFFSVDIYSGTIVFTSNDCDNIIILEPVGGVLQLKPKQETTT